MSERIKMAVACAVGATIGSLVSVLVAPAFWWLGMIAGFAAGYVAYEFRSVASAAPWSARRAWDDMPVEVRDAATFLRTHVFTHAPFVHIGLLTSSAGIWMLVNGQVAPATNAWNGRPLQWVGVCLLMFLAAGLAPVAALLLNIFSSVGARREGTDWLRANDYVYTPRVFPFPDVFSISRTQQVTHLRVIRWTIIGVPTLAIGISHLILSYVSRVMLRLLRAIHSHKRIACGIDSALGTGIAWLTMGMHHAPPVLTMACGGIIGAAFGLMSYEFIRSLAAKNI